MHTKIATMAMIVNIENTQIKKGQSAFNGHFNSYMNILPFNIELLLHSTLV